MIFFSFEDYEFDYTLRNEFTYNISILMLSEVISFWLYDGTGSFNYNILTNEVWHNSI
jgi:hypothetical protein